jgi:hypothetical protein
MRISHWNVALFVLPLALASAGMVACNHGGSGSGSKSAEIKQGEMPAGAKWNGVYFNPLFGPLHLVEAVGGSTVTGRWKTADGSKWGELNGEIQGNVMHYEWTEHKLGGVGPMAITKGKGYFVYTRPEGDNVDDELNGEWGLNDSESGNEWKCVKQRNQAPDLKSIHDEQESTGPSKDWK